MKEDLKESRAVKHAEPKQAEPNDIHLPVEPAPKPVALGALIVTLQNLEHKHGEATAVYFNGVPLVAEDVKCNAEFKTADGVTKAVVEFA